MTILSNFAPRMKDAPRSGKPRISARKQHGISLIELMIAITLGLLIVAVLTTLFVNNSANRREIDRAAGILENGRYAISVLKSDLALAGYYGTLSTPTGTDTTVACSSAVADWKNSLAVHVHGSNQQGTTASDLDSCFTGLTARKSGTDAIVIMRSSTCVAGPTAETGCTAQGSSGSVAYLQVSECGDEYVTTPFVLDLGSASTFTLKKRVSGGLTCAAAGTAPIRQFYKSLYYVDESNNLIRADQSVGGAFTASTLVEGIENIQLQYGFDTNNDGTADVYDTAPPAGNTWADAMGVRVWILARASSATVGYSSDKSFVMDDYSVTPTDSFKRHVFSTYISFINPAGKRFK